MAVSLGYVARETGTNIRRNLLMTGAGILTVFLSFGFAGAALLLRQSVQQQASQFRDNTEIRVFMKAEASQTELDAIRTELQSTPEVAAITGELDKAAAFAEMQKTLSKDALSAVTEADAPPSFKVKLKKADLADAVNDRFQNRPGVYDVVYSSKAIRQKLNRDNKTQFAFFVMSIVVMVGAVVLILTTAQLAILSRRREVAVMKLVGATNWFIRIPFMLEGVLQGVLGAAAAFVFVYVARNGIVSTLTEPFIGGPLGKTGVSSSDAILTGCFLLVVGVILGGVGSAVAVARFLDV